MQSIIAICSCLIASLLTPVQSDEPTELQQAVERQRGGRQWIDLPTDPPKPATESLNCFEVEPGCQIELVAAEPLVFDPVWIDFDQSGHMFVVEYRDYPTGPADPDSPPLSRIVTLTDTNEDGLPDQRIVFAEHLRFCHSLLPLYDGILTCTDTEILFLKDTDGDGVADMREVWFDGFTPAHPQMQIGCPRRGFDNRIWLTYGPGDVRCRRPGFETEEPRRLPRTDFCFDPVTMEFESVTGLGQFGNTIDNEGHRFFSTNRNPIMMQVLPRSLVSRGGFASLGAGHTDVGPSGAATRVFPLVTMKSNWLSHAGTHTSACGVTAYRGHLFDDSFRRSVFVCEPVGHLVTRSILKRDGAALTASRARERADFLASTDTWFRPASLRTGPDGALYVADMYRLWVEHPKFVPPEVAEKMDWRAGEDRGRIWRILPDQNSVTPSAAELSRPLSADGSTEMADDQLLRLLRSPNGKLRDLGQQLIVERQRNNLVPALVELLSADSATDVTRLHALWSLQGLNAISNEILAIAAASDERILRRDAMKILADRQSVDAMTHEWVQRGMSDGDPETRLQACITASIHQIRQLPAETARSLVRVDNDRWLTAAAVNASLGHELEVLEALLETKGSLEPGLAAVIRELSSAATAALKAERLNAITALISRHISQDTPAATALLIGFGDGLSAGSRESRHALLHRLLNNPPAGCENDLPIISQCVESIPERILDKNREPTERLHALSLFRFLSAEEQVETATRLLSAGTTPELQQGLLTQMTTSRETGHADVLVSSWSVLHPSLKATALDWMLRRIDTTRLLMQKMQDSSIPAAAATLDQRMKLLTHRDEDIRRVAVELFGGTVSPNRKQVAETYSAALRLPGSRERGREVFVRTCARCHRLSDIGHQTGPDISDTRSRARDALLYDILDPNRRVDPQYSEYTVVTRDGLVLTGLLAHESDEHVTLQQPESKTITVERANIEEMKASTKSLMPEGIEKDVSVQQMADLLEFLKD